MAVSEADVREILRLIDESDVAELRIETDSFSLHVRKRGGEVGSPPSLGRQGAEPASPPTPAEPARSAEAPPETEDGVVTIDAPMLGTFYAAPDPGAKPFVEVGAEVQPDTIVCAIEVMKMMNSIPAGVAGTIIEVCPQNAQLVEYAEPLFRVRAGS
jgi:acetyl-CoA carboxylase biotin carboxyl carrier protein